MPNEAADFAKSLSETISWCLPRIDVGNPRWCLRSAELRPLEADATSNDPTLWNTQEVIETVAFKRSKIIGSQTMTGRVELQGGRLLMCYFDLTNFNEATADESKGYFDGNDNPPWDTWIGVVGEALVSWVPHEFHEIVERAISVEAVGMLMWLENPVIGFSVNRSDLERLPRWVIRLLRAVLRRTRMTAYFLPRCALSKRIIPASPKYGFLFTVLFGGIEKRNPYWRSRTTGRAASARRLDCAEPFCLVRRLNHE